MSLLEPIQNTHFQNAIRTEQQLGSSVKRNEVNLDSNNGGLVPQHPPVAVTAERAVAPKPSCASSACAPAAKSISPKSTSAKSIPVKSLPIESMPHDESVPDMHVPSLEVPADPHRVADYVSALRTAVGLIQSELQSVEDVLTNQLLIESTAPGTDSIQSMLDYVKELGGKRLRPSLTLLSAKACGGITDETIRLAAAIELVHTATLVHDDIIDNADERRHRPTAHKLWGSHQSVLIGDWLFTHAYELANLGESTLPGRLIARAAKRVCEGEILQGQSIGRTNLEESEYFEILDAKTGALCEISCRLGAWSAGADSETIEAFAKFGSKLGIAFQVYDDWLDVWGDPSSAGKTLGTDLLSLKPTLPTIFALRQESLSAEEPGFKKQWLAGDLNSQLSLRVELDKINASDYTRHRANEIGEEAISSLIHIAGVKALNQNCVEALAQLAYCATHRQA